MKKLTISIFLFISVISSLSGQNVNVTSAFDTSAIYIGDQIYFTISVDQPSDVILTLPALKDTLCKNIEIISAPSIDSSRQDGRVKIIQKYLITSFDSGTYKFPPFFAELKNEEGIKRFYSEYSQLEVMRIKITPADTATKIFDIIKPYKAPVTVGEILPWVLIAALLAALVFFAIRFIRKMKKSGKAPEPVINPDPAHIIAFRELEKLRDLELWQKGEIKNYYTLLTEILRRYLENRYSVFSLELTTHETLQALVKTGFKRDNNYNQLKTILTGADLVKFAKYSPEASEHESHFQNSWDFILATKEVETPVGEVDVKNAKNEKMEGGK
jgi:hypothetical protein